MQHGHTMVTRTIEPNITLFSASEVRVVLLPVGEAPEEVFQRYASLVVRQRQVELNNVRSFYKEAQKSPFKFFPWKTGNMHFKFLPEDVALQPNPLTPLSNHRRILGVVGVMHCPNVKDISKAYQQFEQRCKAFPDAFTLRCFAFEPSDEQIAEDRRKQPNFIMFPPGDWEQLANHAEVVMHDFAACLLAELERWMLNAGPAMVELHTYMDSPEFTGATTLEAVQSRLYTDEEIKTKKRYGRLQKAMGDYCLLAGSPLDAQDHYSVAADLARLSTDWIWLGAALGGYATAKVLEAAISQGAFAVNQSSVFVDEGQWRSPGRRRGQEDPDRGDTLSETSRSSSAFGGAQFWGVLRSAGIESEVRSLLTESKGATRRKGALPLLIEADLKLARFLAGLHGPHARKEVSELVWGLQSAAEGLLLPMDRLQTFVEGAQVLGLVGSGRKRTLMIWQAVELSKMLGFPDASTLEVARKALEPADDPSEAESEEDLWNRRRPLAQAGAPRSWGAVRAGCLEAVLGLAIYSKAHADVWDCAAALLREHPADLSAHRQQSLLENLLAAASQMAPSDRARPGPGPPPLLYFCEPRPPPAALRPLRFALPAPAPAGTGGGGPGSPPAGPFLYDPFSARRAAAQQAAAAGEGGPGKGAGGGSGGAAVAPVEWVCGEVATVDIEVHNPSLAGIRIDKLVLEAEYIGDPSMAPREYMTLTSTAQAAWKPKPVSLNIPANTRPVRIQLEGTPLLKGMLVLTGCRLTAFGGVTWFQPWSRKPINMARCLALAAGRSGAAAGGGGGSVHGSNSVHGGGGGSGVGDGGERYAASWVDRTALPQARVMVAPALPKAQLSVALGSPQLASQDYGTLGMLASPRDPLPPRPSGSGGPSAAGPPPALHLLQGQVYTVPLTVTNTGRLPIEEAGVRVVQAGKGAPRVAITVDNEALARQLPLDPGESATLTATFAAGLRSAHSGTEICREELRLDYAGPRPATPASSAEGREGEGLGEAAAENALDAEAKAMAARAAAAVPRLGRRATLAVEVHVQPSVQVTQVQFREVYLPGGYAQGSSSHEHTQEAPEPSSSNEAGDEQEEGSNGQAGSASGGTSDGGPGFQLEKVGGSSMSSLRRCVMEVGLVNRGRWPLQVWAGRALALPQDLLLAEGAREQLMPPPDRVPGLPESELLLPGSRGTVAFILDPPSGGPTALAGAAAEPQGQAQPLARGLRAASFEERQRGACAERLAKTVGLYFRVDNEEAEDRGGPMAGVAPLVHGEVFNGLTYPALAMLQPPGLTLRITATPLAHSIADTHAANEQSGGVSADPIWEWLTPPHAEGGHAAQQAKQQRGGAAQHDGGAYSLFPGIVCAGGQPLVVRLEVLNNNSSSEGSINSGSGGYGSPPPGALEVEACFACRPVQGGATAAAGEPGEGSALQDGRELTVMWTGHVTGLQLAVGPGESVTHQAGVCLLFPGLYQLTMQRVQCRPVAGQLGDCNTMVLVEPCYVLVQ